MSGSAKSYSSVSHSMGSGGSHGGGGGGGSASGSSASSGSSSSSGADDYIEYTKCSDGSLSNLWVSIAVWVASGHNVYYDGSDCYIVNSGNPTETHAEIVAAGGTFTAAPTLDHCSDSPCSNICVCPYSDSTNTTKVARFYAPSVRSGHQFVVSLRNNNGGGPCDFRGFDPATGFQVDVILERNSAGECVWSYAALGIFPNAEKTTGGIDGSYPDAGPVTNFVVSDS